jgi:hypothetical protein
MEDETRLVTCSKYGRGQKCIQKKKTVGEDNFEMVLNEIIWKGGDKIHLAQDRGQCRALFNTEMSLRVL